VQVVMLCIVANMLQLLASMPPLYLALNWSAAVSG